MFPFPRWSQVVPCHLLLIAFFCFPAARAAAQIEVSTPKAGGRLVCEPCRMDFGVVHIGHSKALPIALSNAGKSPVTIGSKEKHARWVSPEGLSLPYTLYPGHRVQFKLVYRPRDLRSVQGHITYHSNASNRLLPIAVIAQTGSSGTLAASPARLDFGTVAVGNTVTQSQTITNVSNSSVTIAQVTESGTGFSESGISTPLNLAPGHSVTFTAAFTPQKSGDTTGSLIVLSNANNYRLSVVETGTGAASGSVTVSPSAVSFGNVTVGSSSTKTVTLTASGASITIKSYSLNSPEYSLSGPSLPVKLGVGNSVAFQVTFTPQTSGTANANLSFDLGSGSKVTASLNGTGTSTTQHSVSLSWQPDSSSVAGYNVYRGSNSNGPYVKLTSPLDTATDFLDTNVAGGSTYFYEVTAVDNKSVESAPSAPVQATIP